MSRVIFRNWWVNITVFILFLLFFSPPLLANNVAVENVAITAQSTANKTCQIEFDISWDNSWRNQLNYDAVWVFVKYSTDSGSTWSHATLKTSGTNPEGFSLGTGTDLEIFVPSDKKGAFLQRDSNGFGSVDTNSLKLVWDWNADSLSATSSVRVKVFALEMVYVPQASFYLGDGVSERTFCQTGSLSPVQITSSPVVVRSNDANYDDVTLRTGVLVDGDGGVDSDGSVAIDNPNYPTGYNAFYLMKHEISQGAYVDFLNSITVTQSTARFYGSDSYMGYNFSYSGGIYSSTTPWFAMSRISWADFAAFSDWAALRPITELEFEKCGRGPLTPIANEYAWGNTNISTTEYTFANSNTASMSVSNQPVKTGNAIYATTVGQGTVRRVGILATSATSRQEAGSGYYGVLDLSGGITEMVVTLSNNIGRSFQGSNGNGILTSDGYADNSDWPGYESGKVGGVSGSVPQGYMHRGSSFYYTNIQLSVRGIGGYYLDSTTRNILVGGRLGRSAS